MRKAISFKRKLASALLTIKRPDDNGILRPVIPYDDAKNLTDDQIISLFEFDHGIPHAHGGTDEAWNLTPMPRAEHKRKTAKTDIPRLAKTKRIQAKQKTFSSKVLNKECGAKRIRTGKWRRHSF